ncbi:hypothetical protein AAFF_G00187880 [Aldrovandia affinis]|uniref:Immunoglobulin V-set domain-containing protein n=1 Tax=Aldrovandia affinis TaxID=143900 RepID=A0AAD7WVA3_9TELE|nr:hypothetical protein AAFF_G00187880 [Aldrovandia affinis]
MMQGLIQMSFLACCCMLSRFVCQASRPQLGNKTQEEVHAEVGGHVRLPCNHQVQGRLELMYMQKTLTKSHPALVNGYHAKNISPHAMFKGRTTVDPNCTWVDLSDVRVKDEGKYECIIRIHDAKEVKTLILNLKVTANYSDPVVTVTHSNGSDSSRGCLVTCSSSGGYPNARVEFNSLPKMNRTHWMEENESSVQNPVTALYAVSRSVYINCSRPLKLSCTVGGAMSQQLEICNTEHHPGPYHFDAIIITASVLTAILFILVLAIMVKKRKSVTVTGTPGVEAGTDQHELHPLTTH